MESFAALKRSSSSSLDRLTKEIQKLNPTNNQSSDLRFWQPECDKSGNGYAAIRFLPAPQGEEVPWVRVWNHGFKGPGGWYIENSLTTIGKEDPVSELNSKLWNSGIDADKATARLQKRKLTYISNIIVVKDAAHPENDGKVFLYRFGKKIFDKIDAKMHPEFEDEKPSNPFDFWNGCNLKLKIRMVEGYRNYDKSEFDAISSIADTDEQIEKLWKMQYSLQPFVAPDQFKSYNDLKTRLDKVLNTHSAPSKSKVEEDSPWEPANRTTKVSEPAVGKSAAEPKVSGNDDLDFFRKLAEEDDQ